MGMFDSVGVAVNPLDCRALSIEEIQNYQSINMLATQQTSKSSYSNLGQAYYWNSGFLQKPLDERFADFKTRLAAAINRQIEKDPSCRLAPP